MPNSDKFYTQKEDVLKILQHVNLNKFEKIVEPSAGNGAFLLFLPKEKTIALDILPEHKDIIKQDFFNFSIDNTEKILTIGNPPFGKNSSLAVKFFNHAATFSNTILMILPKTFKKISIQNRLNLNFHLEKQIKVSEIYSCEDGLLEVPTIAQLWVKKDIKRNKVKPRRKTKYFDFVKKEEADLSIRRVGFYAGTCYKDIDKSVSSHYFIKPTIIKKEKLFNIINNIEWNYDNTVGSRSVSKHELILELESIINNMKKGEL